MTDSPLDLALPNPVPRVEQITTLLRERVLSGALSPNRRLPTSQQLAKAWDVHLTTVQAALAPLVREGLLLRRPRLGTVVRGTTAALGRVALFQPATLPWSGPERFTHRLERTLSARFAAQGITTEVVIDPRPHDARETPLPNLLRLARSRQIDAVIVCETDPCVDRWLDLIPVPVVACSSGTHTHRVWFDLAQFAHAGVACLAARGCRTVGLISMLPRPIPTDLPPALHGRLLDGFIAAIAATGVATDDAWIRVPPTHQDGTETKAERFGYEAIRAMWSGPTQPDGVLVFTDHAARGVLMGLHGFLGDGRPAPQLALHRNAEIGLFCPLPADFLDTRIELVADALIAQVIACHRGHPLKPELLPFTVVHHDG